MLKTTIATLFAAFCILAPLQASADEVPAPQFKMAVVDMNKVFESYYKTKISEGNLQRQAEVFKEYSNKLNESLQKLQDEFKSLRDASQNIVLTDSERENKRLAAQDKYRQITSKELEIKQYNREKQRQLRDDFDKMRSEIIEEIKGTIKARCSMEGYSLVLDKSGVTLNNLPSVIYNSPAMDITDNIIQELNRGHDEADGASKTDEKAKETDKK